MTIITPEADTTTIDHLDHTIPCEIYKSGRTPCTDPATWWLLAAHHCLPDETQNAFTCQDHHDHLVGGGPVICGACGERFNARPRIIRTERIR